MERYDRSRDRERTEPRHEDRDSPSRTTAPPIEREHETYAGIFEEDERRERESDHGTVFDPEDRDRQRR